jgi:hypothetical protein
VIARVNGIASLIVEAARSCVATWHGSSRHAVSILAIVPAHANQAEFDAAALFTVIQRAGSTA